MQWSFFPLFLWAVKKESSRGILRPVYLGFVCPSVHSEAMKTFSHFCALSSRTVLVSSSSLWSSLWHFQSFCWHSLPQYLAFLQFVHVFNSDSSLATFIEGNKHFLTGVKHRKRLKNGFFYLFTVPTPAFPLLEQVLGHRSELGLEIVPHENVVHLDARVQVHANKREHDELLHVLVVPVLAVNSGITKKRISYKKSSLVSWVSSNKFRRPCFFPNL